MFPQYLDVFCDVTGKTSTMILRQYGTPDKILRGHKKTMIIPGLFEPPVRTLRATIPENESHIFR